MRVLSFDVGIVNMSYCLLVSGPTIKIEKWSVFSLCNGTELDNSIDLFRKLDLVPDILDVDVVLIEKQLSVNPKMRVMADSIRSYLIFRGLFDKQKKFKIINYSSKYKLNCFDGQIPDNLVPSEEHIIDKTQSGKSKMYRFRKKQAIFHCSQLIKDQEPWVLELFNTSKKADDLSDSMLQGMSYIMYDANTKKKDNTPIIKRQPTKKQTKYKKYSKNNMKYLLMKYLNNKPFDDAVFDEWLNLKDIKKNILSLYGFEHDKSIIKKELGPEQTTSADSNDLPEIVVADNPLSESSNATPTEFI